MQHPVMKKGKRVIEYRCGDSIKAKLIKGTNKATLGFKATVGTNEHASLKPTVTDYKVKDGKFCEARTD